MPSSDDYLQLLPEITAVTPEEIKSPNIPFNVFLQEAENLFHWCADDKTALETAGLDMHFVASLPVRAGACREAHSLWLTERKLRNKATRQWKAQSPGAFDTRDHLVHAFRYAFRKQPLLLNSIDAISEGKTNADMVQDLNDLAILGKDNLLLVSKVGITNAMLDNAATLSQQMAGILASMNSEKLAGSDTFTIRNQAYTFLKQAVDEIRNCGKYVFWRNQERRLGYESNYWQNKNNVRRNVKTES